MSTMVTMAGTWGDMKRADGGKMTVQSLTPIFLLAFIFNFALGALGGYSIYMPILLHEQELSILTIGFYHAIVSAIRFLINPVLIFAAFYLIGRNIDLKANLALLSGLVLVGLYVGYFGGYVTSWLLYEPEALPEQGVAVLFSSLLSLQTFFVPFAALALAHIRNQ